MSANLLLDAMPATVRSSCLELGEPFEIGEGASIRTEMLDGHHVFVVTKGVAPALLRSKTGRVSKIGMVGREGFLPLCALMNVPAKQGIFIAQFGELAGFHLRAADFHAVLAPYAPAAELVRRFCYSFVVQIASSMMSCEQDEIGRRLARLLLMIHDRVDGSELNVTHELLAQMSYSQRPTVTRMLRDLKLRGAISTLRGKVTVLDRPLLSKFAEGTYGHAEAYFREYVGPFGKGISAPLVPAVVSAAH